MLVVVQGQQLCEHWCFPSSSLKSSLGSKSSTNNLSSLKMFICILIFQKFLQNTKLSIPNGVSFLMSIAKTKEWI